jgi:hypothetical protein
MILYHYTTLYYLKPDLKPGEVDAADLPPLEPRCHEPFEAAVWLTDERDSTVPDVGICFRIKLVIPNRDSRLHRFKLPQHLIGRASIDWERAARTWCVYQAPIDPTRFRAIEALECQRPWWLIDQARA